MLDMLHIYNSYLLERSLLSVMPEVVLIIFAFITLLFGLFKKISNVDNSYYLSLIGIAFSMLYLLMLSNVTITGFYGSVIFDKFDVFFFAAILLSGLFTILMSRKYIEMFDVLIPEYYSLILFTLAGMMLLVSSINLIMIFLSIEFMSISAYVLTGYIKGDTRSTEAALKYFVLGTFASAFLIFGFVFIYAASGHLNLYNIHNFLYGNTNLNGSLFYNIKDYLSIGLILVLVGLAFKMSLFPFHTWTPDAYDGAPTSVTNLMATGIKIAAFGIFIRIFTSIYTDIFNFYNILWLLAVLTMTFGNIAALLQTNIKRLLAYSSIAQAGFILIGIIAGGYYGLSGSLFYLLSYVFMTAGAFTVVIMFENINISSFNIKSYAGLGYKYPLTAAAMSFFLLSLAGIPVTSGFMSKFFVFSAAIKSKYYWLVFIALLNSAVAAYYYIKIIVNMYMVDNTDNATVSSAHPLVLRVTSASVIVIIICLAFSLLLGILPQPFINFALKSVNSLWTI
jgi:NADH-quinone oxidoreductase subunit N